MYQPKINDFDVSDTSETSTRELSAIGRRRSRYREAYPHEEMWRRLAAQAWDDVYESKGNKKFEMYYDSKGRYSRTGFKHKGFDDDSRSELDAMEHIRRHILGQTGCNVLDSFQRGLDHYPPTSTFESTSWMKIVMRFLQSKELKRAVRSWMKIPIIGHRGSSSMSDRDSDVESAYSRGLPAPPGDNSLSEETEDGNEKKFRFKRGQDDAYRTRRYHPTSVRPSHLRFDRSVEVQVSSGDVVSPKSVEVQVNQSNSEEAHFTPSRSVLVPRPPPELPGTSVSPYARKNSQVFLKQTSARPANANRPLIPPRVGTQNAASQRIVQAPAPHPIPVVRQGPARTRTTRLRPVQSLWSTQAHRRADSPHPLQACTLRNIPSPVATSTQATPSRTLATILSQRGTSPTRLLPSKILTRSGSVNSLGAISNQIEKITPPETQPGQNLQTRSFVHNEIVSRSFIRSKPVGNTLTSLSSMSVKPTRNTQTSPIISPNRKLRHWGPGADQTLSLTTRPAQTSPLSFTLQPSTSVVSVQTVGTANLDIKLNDQKPIKENSAAQTVTSLVVKIPVQSDKEVYAAAEVSKETATNPNTNTVKTSIIRSIINKIRNGETGVRPEQILCKDSLKDQSRTLGSMRPQSRSSTTSGSKRTHGSINTTKRAPSQSLFSSVGCKSIKRNISCESMSNRPNTCHSSLVSTGKIPAPSTKKSPSTRPSSKSSSRSRSHRARSREKLQQPGRASSLPRELMIREITSQDICSATQGTQTNFTQGLIESSLLRRLPPQEQRRMLALLPADALLRAKISRAALRGPSDLMRTTPQITKASLGSKTTSRTSVSSKPHRGGPAISVAAVPNFTNSSKPKARKSKHSLGSGATAKKSTTHGKKNTGVPPKTPPGETRSQTFHLTINGRPIKIEEFVVERKHQEQGKSSARRSASRDYRRERGSSGSAARSVSRSRRQERGNAASRSTSRDRYKRGKSQSRSTSRDRYKRGKSQSRSASQDRHKERSNSQSRSTSRNRRQNSRPTSRNCRQNSRSTSQNIRQKSRSPPQTPRDSARLYSGSRPLSQRSEFRQEEQESPGPSGTCSTIPSNTHFPAESHRWVSLASGSSIPAMSTESFQRLECEAPESLNLEVQDDSAMTSPVRTACTTPICMTSDIDTLQSVSPTPSTPIPQGPNLQTRLSLDQFTKSLDFTDESQGHSQSDTDANTIGSVRKANHSQKLAQHVLNVLMKQKEYVETHFNKLAETCQTLITEATKEEQTEEQLKKVAKVCRSLIRATTAKRSNSSLRLLPSDHQIGDNTFANVGEERMKAVTEESENYSGDDSKNSEHGTNTTLTGCLKKSSANSRTTSSWFQPLGEGSALTASHIPPRVCIPPHDEPVPYMHIPSTDRAPLLLMRGDAQSSCLQGGWHYDGQTRPDGWQYDSGSWRMSDSMEDPDSKMTSRNPGNREEHSRTSSPSRTSLDGDYDYKKHSRSFSKESTESKGSKQTVRLARLTKQPSRSDTSKHIDQKSSKSTLKSQKASSVPLQRSKSRKSVSRKSSQRRSETPKHMSRASSQISTKRQKSITRRSAKTPRRKSSRSKSRDTKTSTPKKSSSMSVTRKRSTESSESRVSSNHCICPESKKYGKRNSSRDLERKISCHAPCASRGPDPKGRRTPCATRSMYEKECAVTSKKSSEGISKSGRGSKAENAGVARASRRSSTSPGTPSASRSPQRSVGGASRDVGRRGSRGGVGTESGRQQSRQGALDDGKSRLRLSVEEEEEDDSGRVSPEGSQGVTPAPSRHAQDSDTRLLTPSQRRRMQSSRSTLLKVFASRHGGCYRFKYIPNPCTITECLSEQTWEGGGSRAGGGGAGCGGWMDVCKKALQGWELCCCGGKWEGCNGWRGEGKETIACRDTLGPHRTGMPDFETSITPRWHCNTCHSDSFLPCMPKCQIPLLYPPPHPPIRLVNDLGPMQGPSGRAPFAPPPFAPCCGPPTPMGAVIGPCPRHGSVPVTPELIPLIEPPYVLHHPCPRGSISCCNCCFCRH